MNRDTTQGSMDPRIKHLASGTIAAVAGLYGHNHGMPTVRRAGALRALEALAALLRRTPAVVLLALVLVGCRDAAYREADRATYDALAGEYVAYVQSDAALDAGQKRRRILTVTTWGMRCGAVAAVGSGQ